MSHFGGRADGAPAAVEWLLTTCSGGHSWRATRRCQRLGWPAGRLAGSRSTRVPTRLIAIREPANSGPAPVSYSLRVCRGPWGYGLRAKRTTREAGLVYILSSTAEPQNRERRRRRINRMREALGGGLAGPIQPKHQQVRSAGPGCALGASATLCSPRGWRGRRPVGHRRASRGRRHKAGFAVCSHSRARPCRPTARAAAC